MLAERESVIQKVETSQLVPSMALARKLEKALNIKLVEQHEEEQFQKDVKAKASVLTLGDMLNLKK